MTLNDRSVRNLIGVHPDLVKVVQAAAEKRDDFVVTEGLRTIERQRQMVAEGKSTTMNSRHLTGHAVDLAIIRDGKAIWTPGEYIKLANVMQDCAKSQGVALTSGAFWTSFKDYVHHELSWYQYPKESHA